MSSKVTGTRGAVLLSVILISMGATSDVFAQAGPTCERNISADVVALDQVFFWNRLGAVEPQGMMFALLEDVEPITGAVLSAGNAQLIPGKRPRPIALRMNVGDCLTVNFTNLLSPTRVNIAQPATRTASLRAVGMQLVSSMSDDGSNVGTNTSSLVAPGGSASYTFYADREASHVLYSAAANVGGEGNGGSMTSGLFGAVSVQKRGAEWYRSQVTNADIELARTGTTPGGHPIINYDAVYPVGHPKEGRPIFKMLDASARIRHSDLTAIITGVGRGDFPAGTYPPSPVYPNRDRSFREFVLIYHDEIGAVQAFPIFNSPVFAHTLKSVRDAFAINYGTGGIGSEILANRFGVGPVWDCTECKYEEFFLSSWALGDPAMVVDVPANSNLDPLTGIPAPGPKATKTLYPDDPSNVYHSYLQDRVKMRILHGGAGETHLHHLHAHQWVQTPDADTSTYLDSQALSPGDSFTLEMVYNSSGNRNQTVGDSIFHCHFYPHFAQGMWSLWRVHDVFEEGTILDANGRPAPGARALPDAEIVAGTPIPAVVPIPTRVMAPLPGADIDIVQKPGLPGGQVRITGAGNPGYPFFIPGVHGHRPPHPVLDTIDDGGLPRHVITGGEAFHIETRLDFTKDLESVTAVQLAETGEPVELAAMAFHAQRLHPSFRPDGAPGDFIANGLPPVRGAPYADPCVDDAGIALGSMRVYKAADLQIDAVLNKLGWHFPQTRVTTLWDDVVPTMNKTRPPEPFFFRANTDDCIEYWLTNLVPSYYELDDFQVRTPTDVLGQHIHLVKFDVTSSDGSGNGWNYEDGVFSPDEVRERMRAIRTHNLCTGDELTGGDARDGTFECPIAEAHPTLGAGPGGAWLGAQTGVQRWYADDVLDNGGNDRTLRTVFTHDHFGPSTHQQAGLYAGLVVEPKGSVWRNPETGEILGGGARDDGGPTSFRADILTADPADSYREFMLEFADFQLAYLPGGASFPDPARAINPSFDLVDGSCPGGVPFPCPEAVSSIGAATMSVNYRNEPIPERLIDPLTGLEAAGEAGDAAHVFRSILRADPVFNTQPTVYPPLTADVGPTDPFTPILRVYENDKVQIRSLVGATEEIHSFSMLGLKWLHEPSYANSGYRASQIMGISEHFEREFTMPPYSGVDPSVDYLYMPGSSVGDLRWGTWGVIRSYNGAIGLRGDLLPLPNNPTGDASFVNAADFTGVCPSTAPVRQVSVTCVTAAQAIAPSGTVVYNSRATNGGPIHDPTTMLYVRTEDLDPATGKLKAGVPIEPLILRAAAGDCIDVTFINDLDTSTFPVVGKPSDQVGLYPQLVAYDADIDSANVGRNLPGTIGPGASRSYRWYAGEVTINADGTRTGVPIEFGATNLMPSDPTQHAARGMVGALIIEPLGSTWVEDADTRAQATVTKSDATTFRDFVVILQDNVNLQAAAGFDLTKLQMAVNYRTEPTWQRMGFNPDGTDLNTMGAMDFTDLLSNVQVGGDPETPIFTAEAGTPVRFRLLFPGGNGGSIPVFTLHGHVWERQPYINDSTEIGDNPLEEWTGAQHIGPTGHFNIVPKHGAGGRFAVPGDYLYRSFPSSHLAGGLWGIFRVTPTVAPDCTIDADCDDGLYCNGIEVCVNGICEAGPAECPSTCEHCQEDTDDCGWCIFDHNFNGVTDGLDFGFFSGCFGACYPPGDPCEPANYNADAGGCVGGSDFGALSGCFALTCADCTLCAGPGGGAAALNMSAADQPSVALQVVAVSTPSTADFAETLPTSSAAFSVKETVYLELWANLGAGAEYGLSSVYADLSYDSSLMTIEENTPGASFENFARLDLEGSVGGCAPLGDGTIGMDATWVRVATLKMRAQAAGDVAVNVVSSEKPFGVSIFGQFDDVDPTGIEFGRTEFRLSHPADVAGNVKLRDHDSSRGARDSDRAIEKPRFDGRLER